MDNPGVSPGKIAREAKQNARQVANNEWSRKLARLGFATKGLVYILIGGLAVMVALGQGGETTDRKGAVTLLQDQPFGNLLLILVTIGLFGFALWEFIAAIFDTEGKGSEPKGIASRLGYAGVGISYAGLGLAALQLVLGAGSAGQNSDATAQDWTARLLNWPFGTFLVILAGLAIIGFGLFRFYKIIKGKFEENLELGQMKEQTRQIVCWLARFGLGAQGIVFGLIGVFLIVAALQHNPGEARGLGGTLQKLAEQSYGPILLGIVAFGLVAYGLFSLFEARYHRFRPA